MNAESTGEASLDVYARPFVPYNLRAINEAPATIIPSLPVRWINFSTYVGSFAGTSFLQADPPPPDLTGRRGAASATNVPTHSGTTPLDPDGPEDLIPRVYHAYWQNALIQEAAALQRECEEHALYKVALVKADRDPRPDMYWLHVPGLRELSLRIENGDIVQLRQLYLDARGQLIQRPQQFGFNAVVWGIDRRQEVLTLCVNQLTLWSMKFNVCFTVQAGRLGALYRSVMGTQKALDDERDGWLRSMLFPSESDGALQWTLNKAMPNLDLHDELLNYEQIRAVDTVLANNTGRVPYLISGPPGTGKTKTLVELALQLISKESSAHLLVCAPSDPAADTLLQRLSKHLRPSQLLRLTSPSRSFPEVPGNVLPFCYIDGDMFSLPSMPQMMRYRIVITTCRDAELMLRARLSNADLYGLEMGVHSVIHPEEQKPHARLHWTALLLDEAAQATEPEVLIPLSVVAPPRGYEAPSPSTLPLFVMAGDQNQLGPRTASRTIALQISLFERLLDRPLYRNHPLARSKQSTGVMRPLTQDMLPIVRPPFANLIRNYRSHPAILATPSSLFYNDTLEPEASNTDALLDWQGWQGQKWPVLFACNTGHDEIEQDGGGWYNKTEAKMACEYALSFLQAGTLQPHEICIMSPFRAQVRVLRQLARQAPYNMVGVDIGPLEAFQGLESRLVILCTTRTRDRFIEQDIAKGLGVIHEPRRFNVALTRAKEGLVVIGDPEILRKDKHWAAFLAFCARNSLWEDDTGRGQSIPDGMSGPVSKLERQMLHAQWTQEDRVQDAVAGVRKLGFRQDEDADAWQSGVAVERALQEGEESDGWEY